MDLEMKHEDPQLSLSLKVFSLKIWNGRGTRYVRGSGEEYLECLFKGVFGLTFGFGFCPLKAKSQPKGWIQEAAFSKSWLSHSSNLKAPLNLLLDAFRMELWKHISKNF
jgi:hypothetical protein